MGLFLTAEDRIKRLQIAADRVGGKAALGRLLGYKDGAFVGQMLRGERPVSEKTMQAITEHANLVDLFSFNAIGGGMKLPANDDNLSNVTELDPQRIRVPLISWIQAGEFSDVVDLFHPGEAVQWEDAIKSNPSRHSYALMVEGDSMVSQTGVHSFPPGTVLIVDPERAANAGDFVIAKDVQTQKATFKQLTTDGARWYLKPLNTQYPTIEIDDPALRVIGRVIEAKPPSVKL